MEFILSNWKWIAFGAVVLVFIISVGVGVNSAIPSSEALKAWSMQEAVFYGCCVIAFAIFVGR